MSFKSFFQPNSSKVLFYYPRHFNRSAEGTNPFFDPLIQICVKTGLEYDVYEEPDTATNKPHNSNVKSASCFFWSVIIIRKLVRILMPKSSWYRREKVAAQIFNILTFGYWRYRKYVSISGSMEVFFLALNPKADVLEMQHGIDYSNKISYFDNCVLKESYQSQHWHLLSWGEGYRTCVIRGHENDYNLKNRVHVVGYPMYRLLSSPVRVLSGKFTILFSFQFTHDWDFNKLKLYKQVIWDTLQMLEGVDCEVLFKHHPRYNNCIDLSDLYNRFSFAHETCEMLSSLQQKIDLHVTLNSTTAFEFAEVGIPSYFLHNAEYSQVDNLFYKEYSYPLYAGMNICEVVDHLKENSLYQMDSSSVMDWYKLFYSPLDENRFVALLK